MKDKKYFDFQKKSIMALLQNKQKVVSSKIGFVKRFRLWLGIVTRHSTNVELQNAKCRVDIITLFGSMPLTEPCMQISRTRLFGKGFPVSRTEYMSNGISLA